MLNISFRRHYYLLNILSRQCIVIIGFLPDSLKLCTVSEPTVLVITVGFSFFHVNLFVEEGRTILLRNVEGNREWMACVERISLSKCGRLRNITWLLLLNNLVVMEYGYCRSSVHKVCKGPSTECLYWQGVTDNVCHNCSRWKDRQDQLFV